MAESISQSTRDWRSLAARGNIMGFAICDLRFAIVRSDCQSKIENRKSKMENVSWVVRHRRAAFHLQLLDGAINLGGGGRAGAGARDAFFHHHDDDVTGVLERRAGSKPSGMTDDGVAGVGDLGGARFA